MTVTVLCEQRETALPDARAEGDALWLARDDVARATGWNWKPEGLCRDDVCVPVPARAEPPLARDAMLDLAGMWRHTGQPVVRDAGGTVWVLGTGAAQRADALASLEAPDFELDDLDGRRHRLSDHRGRKVLLATWASW